jgi:predicted MPP superfamily phosphohydrolase
MKKLKLSLILIFQITLLLAQKDFSFVFLPDLHLQPDSSVLTNFKNYTLRINELHPDFILTGGDMIYTAKSVDDKKAKVLFDLMDKELKLFKMPVYLTMGNHENVGITQESGIDKSNPMWGKQMYEKRYTSRYYSFSFEGWKFFILDGIKILEKEKNYTQGVDSLQINWIRDELLVTDKGMPIVISIHTPLINPNAMSNSKSQALSENSEAVLNLFKEHNLRVVLQGHNHIYMNLLINGIHYISGGSTAFGTDRINDGFIAINIKNNTEKIKFLTTSK